MGISEEQTYDPEIQMDIFHYSQGVSVLRSVTKSAEAAKILQRNMESSEKSIDIDLLDSVIDKGRIEPKFNKYTEAMSLADNGIEKIIDEGGDTDSSMKIFQQNISSFLKR